MKRFNNIGLKFVVTSTIILVIAMVVAMVIATVRFEASATDTAKADLQRTAEENAAYISSFYDDKTRLCTAVSEEDLIIQSCIDQANGLRGNQGGDTSPPYVNYAITADPDRWDELCVYLNRNWSYWEDQLENLFVGDIYGYAHCGAFEVLGIPTSGIPMNFEGRGGNYWARAMEGEVAFGDLEQSPVPGHDYLASPAAVPVYDSEGLVCGLAGLPIRFDYCAAYIENNKIGDTGYTILLDRYGRILAHPTDEYCLHGLPEDGTLTETYLEDLGGTGWASLQENMVAQTSGFTTVKQGGEEYQVYYTPVEPTGEYTGMDLSIASVVSTSELEEEATSMRNLIIIVTVVAIVIAVILSYLVSRMIVSPINKLREAADKLSKGDMDVAIDIKSKDEIGDLAESFNRMAASLRIMMQEEKESGGGGSSE